MDCPVVRAWKWRANEIDYVSRWQKTLSHHWFDELNLPKRYSFGGGIPWGKGFLLLAYKGSSRSSWSYSTSKRVKRADLWRIFRIHPPRIQPSLLKKKHGGWLNRPSRANDLSKRHGFWRNETIQEMHLLRPFSLPRAIQKSQLSQADSLNWRILSTYGWDTELNWY